MVGRVFTLTPGSSPGQALRGAVGLAALLRQAQGERMRARRPCWSTCPRRPQGTPLRIDHQGLFIIDCQWSSSFVVSLSNHERAALRQTQDERMRARRPRSKWVGARRGEWLHALVNVPRAPTRDAPTDRSPTEVTQVPQRASSEPPRGPCRARPSSVPPWSAAACSGKRPRQPSRVAPPARRLSASRRS